MHSFFKAVRIVGVAFVAGVTRVWGIGVQRETFLVLAPPYDNLGAFFTLEFFMGLGFEP